MPSIEVALSITDIECLWGHCRGRENAMRRFPGSKAPSAPRLGRWSRYRELPDPELRPDQLELVLPGELTRLGCHGIYLTSRGEIDQPVGHNWGVLQTLSGAETKLSVPCPGMQRVENPFRRADKERAAEKAGGERGCSWVLNCQMGFPVAASRAYRKPSREPM